MAKDKAMGSSIIAEQKLEKGNKKKWSKEPGGETVQFKNGSKGRNVSEVLVQMYLVTFLEQFQ